MFLYTILLADDERNILDVCEKYLCREGFAVLTATDGEEAMRMWSLHSPDLIVLDLMMPRKDGWQVCREIRDREDVPIILLTARGEETDRLTGLTMGADDFITKPFSPRELVLRIKNVLRRLRAAERNAGGAAVTGRKDGMRLQFEHLDIRYDTRTVTAYGHEADLTVKEFDLLWLLASRPQQVFSRNHLLDKIWNSDYCGDTTTVTVHIRRLREKIERNASQPQWIKTVWGIGYKFDGGGDPGMMSGANKG